MNNTINACSHILHPNAYKVILNIEQSVLMMCGRLVTQLVTIFIIEKFNKGSRYVTRKTNNT